MSKQRQRELEHLTSQTLRRGAVVLACFLAYGCGSDSDEGSGPASGGSGTGGPGAEQLFSGEPDCPKADAPLLRIQGSVDGAPVDIEQQGNDASGGFTQLEEPELAVPFRVDEPDPALAYVRLFWTGGLAHGQAGEVIAGSLILPESHSAGGETWCVDEGVIGMVAEADQATQGSVKFSISGLRGGAECSGALVPAEITGCWVSSN